MQFLEAPEFRNVTLKCLAEIAALNVGPEYDPKFVILFAMVMTSINRMIPPSTNIAQAYSNAGDAGQELVLNLSMFLANFLSNHVRAVESEANRDVLLNAHLYMVKVSQVDEREIFKICLEYWLRLVAELYEEIQSLPIGESGLLMGLSLGGSGGAQNMLNGMALRKNIYSDVLSNLRLVVIERMVKPEEVRLFLLLSFLQIADSAAGPHRRKRRRRDRTRIHERERHYRPIQVDAGTACVSHASGRHGHRNDTYGKAREAGRWLGVVMAEPQHALLGYWFHFRRDEYAFLLFLMYDFLILCSADEETEKRFLVTVIKDLLGLCEIKRGKDNKAVVASDIMYIVGQYPRFLKAHWKFLKTVVNKLFEFMHETHEGLSDTSLST